MRLNDILNEKISDSLIKAKIEAKKHQLDVSWIDDELNGYPSSYSDDSIPKYREMSYKCEVHGYGSGNQYGIINVSGLPEGNTKLLTSINEIEGFGEYFYFSVDPETAEKILNSFNSSPMVPDRVVMKPTNDIKHLIISGVRHRLIDWLKENNLLENELENEGNKIQPMKILDVNIHNTQESTNNNINNNSNNITIIDQIVVWKNENKKKFWLLIIIGGLLVANDAASDLASNLQYYPNTIKEYIQTF